MKTKKEVYLAFVSFVVGYLSSWYLIIQGGVLNRRWLVLVGFLLFTFFFSIFWLKIYDDKKPLSDY